jgi:hypothetical protein
MYKFIYQKLHYYKKINNMTKYNELKEEYNTYMKNLHIKDNTEIKRNLLKIDDNMKNTNHREVILELENLKHNINDIISLLNKNI